MSVPIKRLMLDHEPDNIEFGKRLKEILTKRGMTQTEVGKIMGWSRCMIYYYTIGRKQMRIKRFAELVNKLSLTIAEVGYLLEAYWGEDDG